MVKITENDHYPIPIRFGREIPLLRWLKAQADERNTPVSTLIKQMLNAIKGDEAITILVFLKLEKTKG